MSVKGWTTKKGKESSKILFPTDKLFADKYIETQRLGMSALAVFPDLTPTQATTKAQGLIRKDAVREYINNQAMGAMTRIVKLSVKSKNLNVRLAANKDIMDRAGYKPQEAQININVPLYLPAEVMEKYNLREEEPIREINTSTKENN